MIYNCCGDNRRAAVLGNPNVNGIDYLEVLDHDAIALGSPRQQTLLVHCLRPAPTGLTSANVLIEGGETVTGIAVQWLSPASTPPPLANPQEQAYFAALANAANVLVIRTNEAGDFSTYTLRLVNDSTGAQQDPFDLTEALAGFDPQLAEVEFSFKVECGPDFDCLPQTPNCPPAAVTPPPINYLAKDYGSFRSILLDRLNQLLPNWGATSEADLGVALAELIAYVGDNLSYRQDAIATEAYIETARSRVSLRRHALLVDYHVHDGCNARAWVQLQVTAQVFMDRTQTRFYTYAPGMPASLAVGSGNEEAALVAGVTVFEPMQDAVLYPEHNQMSFYTWGDTDCCLPAGSTEATLAGTFPNLQPGDVLIFEEVLGPQTGIAADADIRHRCAVRLTQVATTNGSGQTLVDPLFELGTGLPIVAPAIQQSTPATEIQWSSDDALPFPVCLSSTFLNSSGDQQTVTDVSIVLGNVVLADQGLSFSNIKLGTVPAPRLFYPANMFYPGNITANRCQPTAPTPLPVRFRPAIPDSPITQAVPLPLAGSPVTPGAVMLSGAGAVSLTDSNGIVCLMIQAADLFGWPSNFGVTAAANAAHPANIDLAVVYAPGSTPPVVVESFPDLPLNSIAKQINQLSKFIAVPASYTPPATPPAGFPAAPTMLANAGTVNLVDTGDVAWLTVQATNPAGWAQSFGVIAQGNQQNPDVFNLAVVYNPSSGGVGVNLPVTVEQFNNVSLATVASQFNSDSQLISVQSFAEAPNASLSAYDLMNFDPSAAVPEISLTGTLNGVTTAWTPQQNLLEDDATSPNFVMEVESSGAATLRFGDNTNGKSPQTGTSFVAAYRIGNGTAGNVGAESLVYQAADPRIVSCANPLPATGGVDPETSDQIRRRAPQAFLTQERAVTMPDYESVAESTPGIDQAVATLRWTGSWYTVFLAAEPQGGGSVSTALAASLKKNVERYRLAGQDLQVESPQYVALEIVLQVCVDPGYFQRDVEQSLLAVLGASLFNPDTFTFGQTVYLSPIYAAARSVAGVVSVTATTFQPQGVSTGQYLAAGEIPIGAFQVARLANDPGFPDRGQLTLVMMGGK
jgi:hypothetical protein